MSSFLDKIGSFFGFGGQNPAIQNLPKITNPIQVPTLNLGSTSAASSAQLAPKISAPTAANGVLGAAQYQGTVGAPAAGGGGIGNPQQAQPSQPSYEEIQRRQYADQLNQANSQYDQYASTLNNQLGDLGNQKNSLLDQIGATYGNVRQQAQDTLAKNVAALDQGKQGVQQGYSNLRTEQSRLLGDTELRNRNLARALGSLNSSYYENLQNKANATTQANVSKIGQQEQSQLDQIGQEIVNQNTDANTKIQGLNETEAAAKNDILSKFQSAYNSIQSQLGFSERNKLDAVQAINHQLQNSLDNIALTLQGYKQQAASAASAQNPLQLLTGKTGVLPQLTSINSEILQPVQQNNVLNQAYADLNGGQKSFADIVGYLGQYDKGYGTKLADQFQANAQQTGGINLPIVGTLGAKYTAPQAQFQNPQSYLDQILGRR